MSSRKQDERWFARHFPTSHAREAADLAVDALPATASMQEYLDAWFAAYIAAGGRTDFKFH